MLLVFSEVAEDVLDVDDAFYVVWRIANYGESGVSGVDDGVEHLFEIGGVWDALDVDAGRHDVADLEIHEFDNAFEHVFFFDHGSGGEVEGL